MGLRALFRLPRVAAKSRWLQTLSFRAHPRDIVAERDSIRIVDCETQASFDRAHIPGSVLLPAHPYFKSPDSPNDIMEELAWETLCAELRITRGTKVVFVDAHPTRLLSMRAAWVWRYFGHSTAWFLDGGWTAYVRSGARVSVGSPTAPLLPLERGTVRAEVQHPMEATRADVLRAAAGTSSEGRAQPVLQLLDTRTLPEHVGDDLRSNQRGGTIPRSICVPHAQLFAADGSLESPEQLRARFTSAGLDLDAPIAAFCQLGIRAAVAAIALHEAGCPAAAVYEGGASEWLNDPSNPVARPGKTESAS